MNHPPLKSSGRLLTHLQALSLHGSDNIPLNLSRPQKRAPCFSTSMSFYYSFGRKVEFLKSWETHRSSHDTRTRVIGMTAATTAISPSLALLARPAFTNVVLKRVQNLDEPLYPEAQCGFRATRSTVNMVFAVRQLQEKSCDRNNPSTLPWFILLRLLIC